MTLAAIKNTKGFEKFEQDDMSNYVFPETIELKSGDIFQACLSGITKEKIHS